MTKGSDMSNMYGLPADIQVTAEGGLRIITLNRPDDLNASTTEMLFSFASLFQALADDKDAHVAILTGAGRAFSAGNPPTMPAVHCAITRRGLETMNIGAPITGIRSLCRTGGRLKRRDTRDTSGRTAEYRLRCRLLARTHGRAQSR